MKKDTKSQASVSKTASSSVTIGDPKNPNWQTRERRVEAAAQPLISSRYIDSRLKQFCCR